MKTLLAFLVLACATMLTPPAHAACDARPTVHLSPNFAYRGYQPGAGTVLVRPGGEADFLCTVKNNDDPGCPASTFYTSVETAYGLGVGVIESTYDSSLTIAPKDTDWTILFVHVTPQSQAKKQVFVGCFVKRYLTTGEQEVESYGRIVVIDGFQLPPPQ